VVDVGNDGDVADQMVGHSEGNLYSRTEGEGRAVLRALRRVMTELSRHLHVQVVVRRREFYDQTNPRTRWAQGSLERRDGIVKAVRIAGGSQSSRLVRRESDWMPGGSAAGRRVKVAVSGRCSTFPLITEGKCNMLTSVTESESMSKPTDLVQGTLDLLLLKIVALEPLHAWAISQRLKQVSGDVLQVSDGSLYPALHKLEQEG